MVLMIPVGFGDEVDKVDVFGRMGKGGRFPSNRRRLWELEV
jgi:hypothetical protein